MLPDKNKFPPDVQLMRFFIVSGLRTLRHSAALVLTMNLNNDTMRNPGFQPLCFIVILFPSLLWGNQAHADPCKPWAGRALSIQGQVEVSRSGTPGWHPVGRDDLLCSGDSVRVKKRSRVVILMPNKTLLRLDQGTTVTFTSIKPEKRSWLSLLKGAIYFISRTPRSLKITTPFVNAAIEGTEFLVRVAPADTSVWVFEGQVAVENIQGSLLLNGGEAAFTAQGQAPVRQLVIKPRDAVQWALYYPPVMDNRPSRYAAQPYGDTLERAIEEYRKGRLAEAFSLLDRVPAQLRHGYYFNLRAGMLLSVGRVDEAKKAIERTLGMEPNNGVAYALRSVIAVTRNENARALELAQQAVQLSPDSPVPLIALSYAYQALFDMEQALQSVRQAIRLAPEDGLAWARVAELELANGYLGRALDAAQTAVSLSPDLALTQLVLGFASLSSLDTERAEQVFSRAIELDQANPLSRLGLGLAKIQRNELDDGVQEIEIAASLDPANSLVRSYLGKGYYEQKRTRLAASEFAVAKRLDPKDPTPWFYDAILKQSVNRPVEALHDLRRSMALNDNRAVYRSRLLLDMDQATRGTSLARIFDDLGFQQRALVTSTQSLSLDPANASAHRFLSSTYTSLPRHGIAQVSELLQSQLLQTLNVDPVEPRLSLKGVSVSPGARPAEAAFNEYAHLFVRQRPWFTLAGGKGNNDTWGDEAVLWGQQGRASYSLGQFHYETDGFRDNANIKHDIYNGFTQVAVTEKVNLQFEYRYRKTDQGDIRLELDPAFQPTEQRDLRQKVGRAGLRFSPAPDSDLLASLIYSDRNEGLDRETNAAQVGVTDDRHGFEAEAQYLLRKPRFNLTLGVGAYRADARRETDASFEPVLPEIPGLPDFPDFPDSPDLSPPESEPIHERSNFDIDGENVYAYTNITYPARLVWTLGLSHETYKQDQPDLDLTKTNPKLGLRWEFSDGLTLRAAFVKTLKRLLVVDQTIEPTQVAGFNQFFDDPNGTQADLYGIGLDAVFNSDFYGGLEYSRRELTVPSEIATGSGGAIVRNDRDEDLVRAYLYWAPRRDWALTGEYRFEHDDPDAFDLKTHMLPLEATYFSPTGLFVRFGTRYVRQEQDSGSQHLNDSFTIADVAVGYRLPKRRGVVSLGVNNLFDKQFHYKDASWKQSDKFNILHLFEPDRTIMARLVLNF